jgi:hypothetical protein
MRSIALAAAAAVMAVPVAIAVPAGSAEAHQTGYSGPTWRGRDGRLYCRRSNGTTGSSSAAPRARSSAARLRAAGAGPWGTVVGGAAGALVGREVQRRRSVRRCR